MPYLVHTFLTRKFVTRFGLKYLAEFFLLLHYDSFSQLIYHRVMNSRPYKYCSKSTFPKKDLSKWTLSLPRTWWCYQTRLQIWNTFFSIQFFRDNGIVIGVTCWQWVAELALTILATIIHIIRGKNRAIEHGMTLFASGFSYVILPAFYLMADRKFRYDFDKKGFWRAIVNSLAGGPRLTNVLIPGKKKNQKKILPIV